MNRTICITEKLKCGNMSPVYFHFDVTPDGTIIRKQISIPGKHENKEVGMLLDEIAKRINSETMKIEGDQ